MNPFHYGIRSLLRARGFTAATITTIALATGAACAVFGLVNAVLIRPLPYPDSNRLAGLWHTMPGLGVAIAKQAPGTYNLYRDAAKSFDEMGVYISLAATLTYPDRALPPERVRVSWMTASTFSVLGAKPLLGRLYADADAQDGAPPVLMISERLWRTRFGGSRQIIGQRVDVDGELRQIVGVMPASFAFPEARTPVWAPEASAVNPKYVGGFADAGIARLRRGVTPEAAQRELEHILPQLAERYPEQRPGVSTTLAVRQTRLAPIVHSLRDDVIAGYDRVLWLLAATVALLVLVAFSNVASLLLVRVEARRREFAVRSALGASTWGVWQELLAETILLAALGGSLGFGLAAIALRLLVVSSPLGLPRLNEVRVDTSVVLFAFAFVALFALISASIGALRIRSSDTIRALREGGRSSTAGRASQRLRAAFVALEVALSLVMLASSGVLARSVLRLRSVQPGFDESNVFTFWTFLPTTRYKGPTDVARFYREAIERLRQLPGVVDVAATAKLPLEVEGSPYQRLIWADDGSSDTNVLPPLFQATTTTAGYFGAMRIPMIAGRTYDDANVQRGAREAVVSRGFIERFWHDPTGRTGVGKRLRLTAYGDWFTIVGVVGDLRDSTLTQPPIAEVYVPEEPISANPDASSSTTARDMAFVVRTRVPMPGLPQRLRQELHALDSELPFHRPAAMEQIVSDARAGLTFALLVLTVGALTTLALGVVGLYGVIAYVVSLRSREISIRIAVGLTPAAATRMILRQGGAIVAIGAFLGLLVFLVFARLLTTMTFEVSPIDLTTLVAAVLSVAIIAAGATWVPARRAARVDPARALSAD
ncbi:MAG TPA: ABC transporter permease [Gemmatimonadaceae bacterium]|jgi:predicted permease